MSKSCIDLDESEYRRIVGETAGPDDYDDVDVVEDENGNVDLESQIITYGGEGAVAAGEYRPGTSLDSAIEEALTDLQETKQFDIQPVLEPEIITGQVGEVDEADGEFRDEEQANSSSILNPVNCDGEMTSSDSGSDFAVDSTDECSEPEVPADSNLDNFRNEETPENTDEVLGLEEPETFGNNTNEDRVVDDFDSNLGINTQEQVVDEEEDESTDGSDLVQDLEATENDNNIVVSNGQDNYLEPGCKERPFENNKELDESDIDGDVVSKSVEEDITSNDEEQLRNSPESETVADDNTEEWNEPKTYADVVSMPFKEATISNDEEQMENSPETEGVADELLDKTEKMDGTEADAGPVSMPDAAPLTGEYDVIKPEGNLLETADDKDADAAVNQQAAEPVPEKTQTGDNGSIEEAEIAAELKENDGEQNGILARLKQLIDSFSCQIL